MNEVQATPESSTKGRIIELLESTHRTNIGGLLDYLNNKGFFEAAAEEKVEG